MTRARGELGVAVLGVGRQGRRRAQAVGQVPGLNLRWIVDVPGAGPPLDELARGYGCKASTAWEEAIEDEGVDIVLVCTPNPTHARMALHAIELGKHVLVEKPLADALDDAATIVAAARHAGTLVKTGFNYPYRGPIRRGLEHLEAGAIGEVLAMRATLGHAQFLTGSGIIPWYCRPDASGRGAMLDLGIHLVHLAGLVLAHFGDDFLSVVGQTVAGRVFGAGRPDADLEDAGAAIFRSRGGRLVSIEASWVDHRPYTGGRIELLGDGGRIEVDLAVRTTLLVRRRHGAWLEEITRFPHADPDPCWAAELEVFRDAIIGGKLLDGDGAAGLRAQRLISAVYESARAGGTPVRADGPRDAPEVSPPGEVPDVPRTFSEVKEFRP